MVKIETFNSSNSANKKKRQHFAFTAFNFLKNNNICMVICNTKMFARGKIPKHGIKNHYCIAVDSYDSLLSS